MADFLSTIGSLFNVPQPEYITGLLGEDAANKLKQQAATTGLINMGVGYLAQPKNQRYGSALPYLARSYVAGQQGAQGVYSSAINDYETQQKIAEMKRKQEQQAAQQVAIRQASSQYPEYADAIRANPELLKEIIAAKIKPAESQIAKLNPKDYTPESWAAYINSKNDTTQLREATTPKDISLTNIRDAYSAEMNNGVPYNRLDPVAMKAVNDRILREQQDIEKLKVPSQQPTFKDATELRKEFRSNPVVKAFDTQENAFKIIRSTMTNPSAAGDLAGVTKFMKLLDPESVVRESEVGLARNATGLYDKLTNYYQTIASGKILTPPQRADFLDTATNFYNVAREQKKLVENEYANISRVGGLDPTLVVGSPTSETSLSSQDMARKLLEQRKKR